jgi:hypothetical protein
VIQAIHDPNRHEPLEPNRRRSPQTCSGIAASANAWRFQALYEIAHHASAFAWSKVTGRRHSTILDWIRLYNNERGPVAMTYKRTGARKPLFLRFATPLAT